MKNSTSFDLKSLAIEILNSCYLMSLGTVDDAGPWVSDIVFVHDDELNIYWLSKPDARHSAAVRWNRQAAASITKSNNQGEDNVGLQIAGVVTEIEGNVLEMAQLHLKKRKKVDSNPAEILNKGQKWYKLTPSLIEVIYEPLWGFEKRKLNL